MRIECFRGVLRLGVLVAVLAALCVVAPSASAVVVHLRGGGFRGVTPHRGISPASVPGSFAPTHPSPFAANGNLDYNGGPVVHSSAPYLIFWDPSGTGISARSRNLFMRYFTDVASDSGKATNVYTVDRQFTDAAGFADYQQTFGAGQIISDTQPFPTRNATNCPDTASTYPKCVTDVQLQNEISRLINADGLPMDGATSATELTANAPIYFIVTPGNTNICSGTGAQLACADRLFCAYHGSYVHNSNNVLYSSIPMFFNGASARQNPKGCQFDNHSVVQEPNADPADVAIKYLSHEDNETITDPLGTGWWHSSSGVGNEDGDNCNSYGSTVNPQGGTNPNAFLPTLGGSASAGTLYDQLINSSHYYIQSEWSNGDVNCEMRPSAGAVAPSFTASTLSNPGTSVPFNPAASTSSQGFTSTTWNFGDGATSFQTGAPTSVSHTFAAVGIYPVTLSLVDKRGNLATATHDVTVGSDPTAAFSFQPSAPAVGQSVSFDAGGSSDPNSRGSISSYAWNFGDGSPGGSGRTPVHTYATAGVYTVSLTVTDGFGLSSASVSRHVRVDGPPSAGFVVRTGHPASGGAVRFDAGSSSSPNGSIVSYAWSFGDGSPAGSGVSPMHTFKKPGAYTVRLTVIDSPGLSASVSHSVNVVLAATITKVSTTIKKGTPLLVLKFSGPGVLTVAGKRYRIRKPGTTKVPIRLSGSQKAQLRRHHRLRLKLKLTFVPAAGATFTKTETITLKG